MNWDDSYLFKPDDIQAAYAAGAEGVIYNAAEQEEFEGHVGQRQQPCWCRGRARVPFCR